MSKEVIETTEIFENARNYWINKLSEGFSENTFSDIYIGKDDVYIEKEILLDDFISSKIMQLSKGNDLSAYVIILTAFKILLSGYLNHEDILVASPTLKTSNQNYNKCVVFRDSVDYEKTFKEFLLEVRQTVVEGYQNQFYPIRKIIEYNNFDSMTSLFNFIFIYENIHDMEKIASIISEYNNQIILSFGNDGTKIKGVVKYKKGLFEEEKILRIMDTLSLILRQVLEKPDIRILDIKTLNEEEMNQVLYKFNDAESLTWEPKTIIDLYEEHVDKNPQNICIAYLKKNSNGFLYENISYGEMNEKANQLARFLKENGVKNDDIVGLAMTPSVELYTSIIAVMKAGGAYLPLDPYYPAERIEYTAKDSKTKVIITNVDNFGEELDLGDIKIIHLSMQDIHKYDKTNLAERVGLSNLAYIIYTSGTTGKPKGVLIEHKNVINTLQFRKKEHGLDEKDVILQMNPYVFDGFVATFFTPLIAGSKIVAIEDNNVSDMDVVKEAIVTSKVTHFASVPVLYEEMIENIKSEEFESVRSVVLAGDRIRPDIITKSKAKFENTKIIIEYGVSECSVLSTYCMDIPSYEKVLIGKPIANTRLHVLSKHNSLQPIGAVGELCISGIGVSTRGYLNNTELTNQKFIKNPYGEGETLYKTGDLVRWLPDGNLEFLGRKDHQVKIRGFRIELGEIENTCIKHPNIHSTVAAAREIKGKNGTGNEDKILCAYYILKDKKQGIDIPELKSFLSKTLPEYMIPVSFIEIDEIPLTKHGKTDFSKLPEPTVNQMSLYTAPTDEIEKELASIWSEILSINEDIIGIDSSFFDLGGHSLNVTRLVARIYKVMNVKISIADVFEKLTIREIAKLIKASKKEEFIKIEKADKMDMYPVSSAQKRLYFLQQFDKNSTAYNLISVMQMDGNVNVHEVEGNFSKIIKYHESFRTSFVNIEGKIFQKISDDAKFNVDYVDMKGKSTKDINFQIEKFITPFDLSKAPLIKVGIIKKDDNSFVFIVNIHHIIADGISIKNLMNDFMSLYKGMALEEQELQYKDFAVWQSSSIENLKSQKEYWLNRLSDPVIPLDLPLDFKRPDMKKFNGNTIGFEIAPDINKELKNIASQNEVSLFMVCLSIYYIFLHNITNQKNLIVGVPVSGRRNSDLEPMIGMFVNTLGIKAQLDPQMTFTQLLKSIKENTIKDFENQDYQYEDLVNDLQLSRELNRNPLFDTMLNFQNVEIPEFKLPGLHIAKYNYIRKTAKFDLTLQCLGEESDLKFEFEYDSDLFKQSTIERFVGYFKNLINQITFDSGLKVYQYSVVSKEEKEYLINSYNATKTEYPEHETVISLFEKQVVKTPNKEAVILDGKAITYKELDAKSNNLAELLCEKGIGIGSVVGLLMDHSVELIVSIIGILKTGAAYVPISSDYPATRKEYIIKDSHADVLLTSKGMIEKNTWIHENTSTISIITDDEFMDSDKVHEEIKFISKCTPKDCAYIIYTSGSTGQPKGVLVQNRSLTNYIWWAAKNYVGSEEINFPLFTSISFDLTVTSIFTPLITGNTIFVYNDADSTISLDKILQNQKIGIMKLTPSHLKLIRHMRVSNSNLKRLIVGGENLTVKLASEISNLFNNNIEIINEYGPTEATVGCMIYKFDRMKDLGLSVPIGVPADNAQIYILNESLQPVPVGVVGEMYISGECLAKGYVGKEDLTKERFIPNPFSPGKLMYKTGDLAKMNEDWNMEFINRKDSQVKLRGYRVELSEIENQILNINNIDESVVTIVEAGNEDAENKKYLVSYLVAKNEVTESEIREFLKSKLPSFMIPDHFVFVEKIPMTPNGKVDTDSLSKIPIDKKLLSNELGVPKTEAEEKILVIWKDILAFKDISINDNFFDIGGRSEDVLRVVARLQDTFKRDVPVTIIFEHPTVSYLAEYFSKTESTLEGFNQEIEESVNLFEENISKFVGDDNE